MEFNTTDADDMRGAMKYLQELQIKGASVSINEIIGRVTNPQLRLIKILMQLFAIEYGNTLEDVKDAMELDFFGGPKMVNIEGKMYQVVRDYKDLDRNEASHFIEWIYHWCAAKDCVLPTSEELKTSADKYNKIIKQNRAFL